MTPTATAAALPSGWWAGPLETNRDQQAADALYQLSFGYSAPTYRLNPLLLSALGRTGGSVIGVKTDREELVGFAYGFHAVDERGPYHYSQAAVVHPEYQGYGIGTHLKHQQRDFTIRRTGVDRMRWTFHPSLARNAHLNLAKLGGLAIAYDPDYYDLPESERLVVEWTFAGDAYQAHRDAAPAAAAALADRATEVVVPEATIDRAHWVIAGLDRVSLLAAIADRFAAGDVLCWAGRIDSKRAAYLAVPRTDGAAR
ncbi:GNAT family N-acetyltransferase [Microbacterium paludicola]|uniref:GNAT family N-acetyltransferase n=1 Tax=Microbacterium paludicola TaxID=300019 RepID=UPI0014313D72|nr:GNAT family N-acetyltransferase [Microbacterium paludicola]MBF0817183.1 GNAT family N-acetyltransferase [Microbacterium paludicola]